MNVALIYKKSAWELFSDSDDNNVSSFILEDGSQRDLLLESDLVQKQTIDLVEKTLFGENISYKKIYRSTIGEYDLSAFDLVITVGGDGTFLEASHHIKANTPILGVNSDPQRSVGFFVPAMQKILKFLQRLINSAKVTVKQVIVIHR